MRKLVIVVSGPPGAGSSTIAKKLAEKLNLRYYSPGKTYKSYLNEKEAKAALDFWQTSFGSSKELHRRLDEDQVKVAREGNVVICGKLSIYFLKDIADFKVWLDVPLEVRAKRTAERDKIPKTVALEEIKKRQELEREKWKKIYGFDYFELKNYADLVIDSSNLTVEETVDRILKSLKTKIL